MKGKKETTVSKEPVLRKVIKSKRKISTPKAGVSFEKAVKNVKQIFKEKNTEIKAKRKSNLIEPKFEPTSKSTSKPIRKPTSFKEKGSKDRGIVYVGHIPHGFYEEQMKDYFKQFGEVTRVRVARSKKSGRSRGYGYVEFKQKDVAKIAAETMNNYLMCNRLLKATYIPPEKQHFGYFMGTNWSEEKYPKLNNRKLLTLQRNSTQSAEDQKNYVKSSLSKLSALESKLQARGISIKFQPVDVPQP